jgi:hypothetical protein
MSAESIPVNTHHCRQAVAQPARMALSFPFSDLPAAHPSLHATNR